jgi:hypothetical protein
LRRILARISGITVYEGQEAHTGMPVMILKGAQGEPVKGEGVLALLETLPEAWVLEWPLGAVPLSQYLGVAEESRLRGWLEALARTLLALKARGVAFAPVPELCLVKGKRLWLGGVGAKGLEGDPEKALVALARDLAADWEAFPLRGRLEALERGEARLEDLLAPEARGEAPKEAPEPPEKPEEARKEVSPEPLEPEEPPKPPPKRLVVEPVAEVVPAPSSPPEEAEKTPSRPRVIRIEERDEPPFPVVEPSRPQNRRPLLALLLLLALLGLLGLFLRPRPTLAQGYAMEFRTDPPTARAEVILLEVPEGSRMAPGQSFAVPGRVEFDQKGVYRLRIRVPGRDPVDYLMEVPGPPLTIKVR